MVEQIVMSGLASGGTSKVHAVESRLAGTVGQPSSEKSAAESKSAVTPVERSDPFPPPDAFFRANKLAKANPTSDASPAARLAKQDEGRALNQKDLSESDKPAPLSFGKPQLSADSFVAVAVSASDEGEQGLEVAQAVSAAPEFDFSADAGPLPSQVSAANQAYSQGPSPDVPEASADE